MKKLTLICSSLLLSISLFAQSYWYVPKVEGNRQQEYHEYGKAFALNYAEMYEQPWFVAYHRTKDEWNAASFKRPDNAFKEDTNILTGSASLQDYSGSGYSRGHLCWNGACNHDTSIQMTCFLLSNMSPQEQNYFNGGIWADGENAEEKFGKQYAYSYSIVGPVFNKTNYKTIGKNKVAVPDEFYRICVFTDKDDNVVECFAVIMSQAPSVIKQHGGKKGNLSWSDAEFLVSIDEVEKKTGLDFFPALNDKDEDALESYKWSKSKKAPKIKFVGEKNTASSNNNNNTTASNIPQYTPTFKLLSGTQLNQVKQWVNSGKYVKNMAKDLKCEWEDVCYTIGYYGLKTRVITVEKGTKLELLQFSEEDTIAILSALKNKEATISEICELYEVNSYDLAHWLGVQNR